MKMFSNGLLTSVSKAFSGRLPQFNFLVRFSSEPTREETLKKKQEAMMSRGLPKKKAIDGVKHTVLVVSGKGGVGKSTTAVNLAAALAQTDMSVGLLDADVFGPSIPLMMNLNDSPLINKENKMIPLLNHGVKCMSMGFLVSESSAVIWRGLMVMNALDRLLRQVDWSETDCLIVDTPPGTGDTMLSLLQNIPISGVVVVTTPQKAAVQVTRRGVTMLQKLNIPIIGIVSNMSSVQCHHCKNNVDLFGDSLASLSTELGIPVLVNLPLTSAISSAGDDGSPTVVLQPNSIEGQTYKELSHYVADFLKKRKPEIVHE